MTVAGAVARAAPPRPLASGAPRPEWQTPGVGATRVRSPASLRVPERGRRGGGRPAAPTWGGAAANFPSPNSGAGLSAFPRGRCGQKAPRAWAAGGHQLLRPRSGGTPSALPPPKRCSQLLHSAGGRAAGFSGSGRRGSHSEPGLGLLSFAATERARASPVRTRVPGLPSPIWEVNAQLLQTHAEDWGYSSLEPRRLTQFHISKPTEAQLSRTQALGAPFSVSTSHGGACRNTLGVGLPFLS